MHPAAFQTAFQIWNVMVQQYQILLIFLCKEWILMILYFVFIELGFEITVIKLNCTEQ